MAFICEPGETRPDTVPGALHHLKATPKTVHWGYFDAALAPVLRVKSGDLNQAEAITHHAGDAPEMMFDDKERVTIYQLDPNALQAYALYAYFFPCKYLVPGTVTHCPSCDRQTAL